MNFVEHIQKLLLTAIQLEFPERSKTVIASNIPLCATPPFGGHYGTAIALIFAKERGTKNVISIGEAIVNKIPHSDIIEKAVCDKGYINFYLNPKAIFNKCAHFLKKDTIKLDSWNENKNTKVIIDYSSPNIAKKLHVGHLRSTILGNSIFHLLKFCGYDVYGQNHIGDAGGNFGMILAQLQEIPDIKNYPETIDELNKIYQVAKIRYKDDSQFKKNAQDIVIKMQNNDEETMKLWKYVCDISRKEYMQIYEILGVSIPERGESFYIKYIPEIIDELKKLDLVVEIDGALKIKKVDSQGNNTVLVKSNGSYTYAMTDISAIKYRLLVDKAQIIIYVTDVSQETHFNTIFEIARNAGWLKDQKVNHIGFGLIVSEGTSKKYRSSAGQSVGLKELLDNCEQKTKDALSIRFKENNDSMDDDKMNDQLKITAKAVSIGSLKYYDLSPQHHKSYPFSYNKMLNLNGSSALYVQYTYARIISIINKSGKNIDTLSIDKFEKYCTKHSESENMILFDISTFDDVLNSMLQNYYIYPLCSYLNFFSQKVNSYYRANIIIGATFEEEKLMMCKLICMVLRLGCDIIGVKLLDKI